MQARKLLATMATLLSKLKTLRIELLGSFMTRETGRQLEPVEQLGVCQQAFNIEVISRIEALEEKSHAH